MTAQIPSPLLTVREAAALLHLAESTLRGWLCDRRLRFYKVGRRTMLKRQDLEAYIEGQVVLAEAPLPGILERRRRRDGESLTP